MGPSMDRWQWIVDRVPAVEDQRNLALLARVIEVDFGGRVEREKDLTAFMAARYRWGNKTTRRRAMRLAAGGGIPGGRSERGPRAKEDQLVPEAGPPPPRPPARAGQTGGGPGGPARPSPGP